YSCAMDVRPGGTWFRCMRAPDGSEHRKHGVYREIVAPERLVFTYITRDAGGNPGPETLVTVNFVELGNQTKITLHQAPFASVAEGDAHEGGWTGCLERFAEYLADADRSKQLKAKFSAFDVASAVLISTVCQGDVNADNLVHVCAGAVSAGA